MREAYVICQRAYTLDATKQFSNNGFFVPRPFEFSTETHLIMIIESVQNYRNKIFIIF